LEVRVVDVLKRNGQGSKSDIKKYFQNIVRTINLEESFRMEEIFEEEDEIVKDTPDPGTSDMDPVEAKNEEKFIEEKEEESERVLFQYDGILTMDPVFNPSQNSLNVECDQTDVDAVVKTMGALDLTVKFLYIIDPEENIFCDILDEEDLKLNIVNKVGIDEDAGFAFWWKSLDSVTKEAMKYCSSEKGCFEDIEHDTAADGETKTNAHVTTAFLIGRPNVRSPYTKDIILTVRGKKLNIRNTLNIFVEGLWSSGPGDSVALPTYEPIMILRDPPGSSSFASYQNVVTKYKVKNSQFKINGQNVAGLGVSTVGDVDVDTCIGGGFGALVLVCKEIAKAKATINVFEGDITAKVPITNYDEKYSNQFSTTWSYATSTDANLAGSQSDVFVVPNLNIMFHLVYDVVWNNEDCGPDLDEDNNPPFPKQTQLDLESKKEAMSFYTRHHINTTKIPEIEAQLEEIVENRVKVDNGGRFCCCEGLDGGKCPDGSDKNCECDTTEKKDAANKEMDENEKFLNYGLSGWKTALKIDSTAVKDNNKAKIGDWFMSDFVKGNINVDDAYNLPAGVIAGAAALGFLGGGPVGAVIAGGALHFFTYSSNGRLEIDDQSSALAPKALTDNAQQLDWVNNAGGISGNLDEINRIQFSGGGNTYSMTMNTEKVESFSSLTRFRGYNWAGTFHAKLPNPELIEGRAFGFGLESSFSLFDFTFDVTHSAMKTDTDTSKTQVSFTLGDKDKNDEFVVDLYYDERYGSIIFDTVAGVSKCPHEKGTKAGEMPLFDIKDRPTFTFKDDKMMFDLKLGNGGKGASTFSLAPSLDADEGGVELILDGMPLVSNRDFYVVSGKTFTKTLVVKRGPKLYKNKAIPLSFKSTCGDLSKISSETLFNLNDDGNLFLNWIEPCPRVEWDSTLKSKGSFVASLKYKILDITIYNPNVKQFKLKDNERLEHVYLKYRKQGAIRWNIGLDFTDSIPYETTGGLFGAEWNVEDANLSSGQYEIQLETKCGPDYNDAPNGVNTYQTGSLPGVVDFTRPEIYGYPLPLRDTILIGEEISIVFTEPLNCESSPFDLEVTISDTQYKFDKDDERLQVICEGRKISLQIDVLNEEMDLDELFGKTLSVTIGKIGAGSVSEIQDKYGNAFQDGNADFPETYTFDKVFATLNLEETSSLFTFTLDHVNCTDDTITSQTMDVKDEIVSLLYLNHTETGRIEVNDLSCVNSDSVVAEVVILPAIPAGSRSLRINSDSLNSQRHSVSLYAQLRKILVDETIEKRGLSEKESLRHSIGSIGKVNLLPCAFDKEKYLKTNPALLSYESELSRVLSTSNEGDNENQELRRTLFENSYQNDKKMNENTEHIEAKMDENMEHMEDDIDSKMEHMEDDIDSKMEHMEDVIDSKVSKMEENMEKVDEKVETLTQQNSMLLNEVTLLLKEIHDMQKDSIN